MAEQIGRDARPSSTTSTDERSAQSPFGFDPAQFAGNLEPFFVAGSRFVENWRKTSEELLEFGKARLNRNIEIGRRVAHSASLQEAMEAQSEFARTMMQDYVAETSKLVELGNRAISETFEVWRVERQPGQFAAKTQEAFSQAAESVLGRKVAAE